MNFSAAPSPRLFQPTSPVLTRLGLRTRFISLNILIVQLLLAEMDRRPGGLFPKLKKGMGRFRRHQSPSAGPSLRSREQTVDPSESMPLEETQSRGEGSQEHDLLASPNASPEKPWEAEAGYLGEETRRASHRFPSFGTRLMMSFRGAKKLQN